MKKYKVHINEILYYMEKEIEAIDETEAGEKYEEMIISGKVEVNKSGYVNLEVTEVT